MSRPVRRYRARFVHPLGGTFELETEGATPCLAKAAAFEQLEAQKKADPVQYVADNEWWLDIFTPLFESFP